MANQKDDLESVETVHANQLITIRHLQRFKEELLTEIKDIVKKSPSHEPKKWLKTKEVRKLHDISSNKLHYVRTNGDLAFTRIGGIVYYDQDDIDAMFQKNKNKVR